MPVHILFERVELGGCFISFLGELSVCGLRQLFQGATSFPHERRELPVLFGQTGLILGELRPFRGQHGANHRVLSFVV